MKYTRGFSFVEVLVSLTLISGTSLVLLKQQGEISRSVREIHPSTKALLFLDNTREQACVVNRQGLV